MMKLLLQTEEETESLWKSKLNKSTSLNKSIVYYKLIQFIIKHPLKMSHAHGLDESRYARFGGWRREDTDFASGEVPFEANFGYGGPGYGGFGRKGKFGGWRSYYPYGDCTCGKILQGQSDPSSGGGGVPSTTYRFPVPVAPIVNMSGKNSSDYILPITHHSPTFWFGLFLIFAIILGIWYGK